VTVGSFAGIYGADTEVVIIVRGNWTGIIPLLSQFRLHRSSFRRASKICSRYQAEAVRIPNDWFVGEQNSIDSFLGLDGSTVGRESSGRVDGHAVESVGDVGSSVRSKTKGVVSMSSSWVFVR
jgi:hypothetical protein